MTFGEFAAELSWANINYLQLTLLVWHGMNLPIRQRKK
jgi:hypothetical protein